ncbi:hypothetical protein BB561_003485 [Smittium simulii]|uniref:chitin synthase n=1 Tax=Smittium simulii TaxID=133385 RepID=A0A2T9YL14_9FUNG|nr:hypothetical protein BB561_003485 [Smittium simulii]
MNPSNQGFDDEYDLSNLSQSGSPRINNNNYASRPYYNVNLSDNNEKLIDYKQEQDIVDHEEAKKNARNAQREQRLLRTLQAQNSTSIPNKPLDQRKKAFVKGQRISSRLQDKKQNRKSNTNKVKESKGFSWWGLYSRLVTIFIPNSVLSCFGLKVKESQIAWREKIALVSVIIFVCGFVGFITFGLQQVLCKTQERIKFTDVDDYNVVINGYSYEALVFNHPASALTGEADNSIINSPASAGKKDLSLMFQNPNAICKKIFTYNAGFADENGNVISVFPCVMVEIGQVTPPNDDTSKIFCHNTASSRASLNTLIRKPVYYTYSDINDLQNLVIYNGAVLDLNRLTWISSEANFPSQLQDILSKPFEIKDISLILASLNLNYGKCLTDLLRVGFIDVRSLGCIGSNIILYISLIVIIGAVFSKFLMATYFGWFMSKKLGKRSIETIEQRNKRLEDIENWADVNNHYGRENIVPQYHVQNKIKDGNRKTKNFFPTTSRYSHIMPGGSPGLRDASFFHKKIKGTPKISTLNTHIGNYDDYTGQSLMTDPNLYNSNYGNATSQQSLAYTDEGQLSRNLNPYDNALLETDPEFLYTFLMVTCYSEGAYGIRSTLDSLVGTDYPDKYKCLFIVCDGIIKGEGESISTPDICLSMMQDFVIPPDKVQPFSYVSIATGSKRHNMAKLYAGYYCPGENSDSYVKGHKVPMILVVKCGTPAEESDRKPGNRGKRDSQVILMSFLQRSMFDERMSRLEYEMFNAIWNVTGVTPDNFEIVLMVDADTKVYPDSLSKMVSVMVEDHMVMGLCGETKISNKKDSYISMIQVFEYYISHHLAKAFESVFGGVTCLPGCFCMYRIKAPKGQHGYWVPILSNPDIVENYSENIVDSLHKKNLLLLGEDRYLSTLMLRAFPKRKMLFIPSAVCKTIVPNEFKILLSQRRRWINSTVHNLLELVQVNDLCGTFCFSMQFIIFMELVGTVVLPAAITFTVYLIVISFITKPIPIIPLVLLAIILGLPAALIGLTSRKMVYVGWMFVYLSGLIVWNFILPAYSFWHFDDFSWGETRKVEGESKSSAHDDEEGEFDSSNIIMKRWCDFEAEKRYYMEMILATNPNILKSSKAGLLEHPTQTRNVGSIVSNNNSPANTHAELYSIDTPKRISMLQVIAQNPNEHEASQMYRNIQKLGYHVPLTRNEGPDYNSRDSLLLRTDFTTSVNSSENNKSYIDKQLRDNSSKDQ